MFYVYNISYPADEITLDRLTLYEGQRLLYKFDYRAGWEFAITIVRHVPGDDAKTATLVEQTGTSPEQYGDKQEDGEDSLTYLSL